jgi:hypothetical protein
MSQRGSVCDTRNLCICTWCANAQVCGSRTLMSYSTNTQVRVVARMEKPSQSKYGGTTYTPVKTTRTTMPTSLGSSQATLSRVSTLRIVFFGTNSRPSSGYQKTRRQSHTTAAPCRKPLSTFSECPTYDDARQRHLSNNGRVRSLN